MHRARTASALPLVLTVILLASTDILQADEEADRATLRQIKTLYEQVVRSDDITPLLPYLPANLTAVTPTGEEVKGPQQLQAYFHGIWAMIGKGGTYQVKVNVGSTDFYGDIAVSSGTTDETVRSAAGKEFQFPMLWTAVSRKENEQWQVIRMHGSINPLSNVFVLAQLRMTKLLYGGGGIVLGLGVGLLFHFLQRPRQGNSAG